MLAPQLQDFSCFSSFLLQLSLLSERKEENGHSEWETKLNIAMLQEAATS